MRKSRFVVLVALLGGLGYGGWLTWHSSALALRRVEVVGNTHVTKEELAAASGLVPGTNLLVLSTGRVASKIESLAWIRDVRVERIIPSKVRITVTERTAAAKVLLPGGAYIVDEEGVVLDEGGDAPVALVSLPMEGLTAGDRITLPQYHEALRIVRGLNPSLRAKLDRVRAPTVDGITLELSDGVTILYGAAELMREKNFAVSALLNDAASSARGIASIDVRVPRRPAVRLR